jgi:hypothetical protein
MRATIRRNPLADLAHDVEAAIAGLDVDKNATYYLHAAKPGQAPLIEKVIPGVEVEQYARSPLFLVMEEVEQNGPDEITLRRLTPCLGLGGRDMGCETYTFSKVC